MATRRRRRVWPNRAWQSRELGDEWLIAWAFHLLGLAAHIAGRYDEGLARYERALRSRRRLGHLEGIGICLGLMAIIGYRRGEMPLARDLAHDSLLTLHDVGARWVVHNELWVIAALAGASGAHAQAVRLAAARDAFSQLVAITPIPLDEAIIQALTASAEPIPEQSPLNNQRDHPQPTRTRGPAADCSRRHEQGDRASARHPRYHHRAPHHSPVREDRRTWSSGGDRVRASPWSNVISQPALRTSVSLRYRTLTDIQDCRCGLVHGMLWPGRYG